MPTIAGTLPVPRSFRPRAGPAAVRGRAHDALRAFLVLLRPRLYNALSLPQSGMRRPCGSKEEPIDFSLSEEQKQLQKLAREFAQHEIAPRAAHHDETGEFPMEIVRKAWELGLMNTHLPEEYGGLGLGVLEGCLIGEEIAAACSGIGTAMEANQLAEAPVIVGGSEEQKRKWLPPMAEEFGLAAYAVTEPGAGSDVRGSGPPPARSAPNT